MANWTALKAAIAEVIKTNGNKEITGAVLQSTLNTIVSNLGENATFKGVAIPTTVPGTPDGIIFYICTEKGTYTNFNGIIVGDTDGMVILTNSNGWIKINIPLATKSDLTDIGTDLNQLRSDLSEKSFYADMDLLVKTVGGEGSIIKTVASYVNAAKENIIYFDIDIPQGLLDIKLIDKYGAIKISNPTITFFNADGDIIASPSFQGEELVNVTLNEPCKKIRIYVSADNSIGGDFKFALYGQWNGGIKKEIDDVQNELDIINNEKDKESKLAIDIREGIISSGYNFIPQEWLDNTSVYFSKGGILGNGFHRYDENSEVMTSNSTLLLPKGKYVISSRTAIYKMDDYGLFNILEFGEHDFETDAILRLTITEASKQFLIIKNVEPINISDDYEVIDGIIVKKWNNIAQNVGWNNTIKVGYYLSDGTFYENNIYLNTTDRFVVHNSISTKIYVYNSVATKEASVNFFNMDGSFISQHRFMNADVDKYIHDTGYAYQSYKLYEIDIPNFSFNKDVYIAISADTFIKTNCLVFVGDSIEEIKGHKDYYWVGSLNDKSTLPPDSRFVGSQCVIPLKLEDKFNIRFKFRITENLVNKNKNANIAKFLNSSVYAQFITPGQVKEQFTYPSGAGTQYYGAIRNGLRINGVGQVNEMTRPYIGNIAMKISYSGTSTSAYIKIQGDNLQVNDGDNLLIFYYTEYPTVESLCEAINNLDKFTAEYNECDGRMSNELMLLPETKLYTYGYNSIDGNPSNKELFTDYVPLFIRYAVDVKWHQVEIFPYNGSLYCCTDGSIKKTDFSAVKYAGLILGGECEVEFKDIEISTNSLLDAEIQMFEGALEVVVSSVNPYIAIFEGHGIVDTLSSELGYAEGEMRCTPDRLEHIFSYISSKGYIPVSVDDILDWYDGIRTLPKRCYTIMFDDYEWNNFLILKNRAPFVRHGVKANLAIIYSWENPISYNGEIISIDKAVSIGKNVGFTAYSHVNHRHMTAYKPSTYVDMLLQDVVNGDMKGINPTVIVYPYGESSIFLNDCLEWVGLRGGINVYIGLGSVNRGYTNKYNLYRIEIGNRNSMDKLKSQIL